MKKICFFLFAIILISNSCKKTNESFQLSGQYKSNTTASVSSIMMFTNLGQVTNAASVQSFLQRKGFDNAFVFNSISAPITSNLLTLSISQNNTSSVSVNNSASIQAEIISQTSSELIFANIDSIQVSIPNGNVYTSRCDTLGTAFKNINPTKKYYSFSPSTGYSSYYKFRPMFPIETKNDQLVLPVITYVISNVNARSFCSGVIKDEWNTFNPTIINQLQSGDTFVYQTKEVLLIKQ